MVRYILTTVLSVGWTVPLLLALTWTSHGAELLAAGKMGQNSFPYFAEARQAALIAVIWAALAGAAWIAVFQRTEE